MNPDHLRAAIERIGIEKDSDYTLVMEEAAKLANQRLPVECGSCGWAGKRKPGNIVMCPSCSKPAAFQCET